MDFSKYTREDLECLYYQIEDYLLDRYGEIVERKGRKSDPDIIREFLFWADTFSYHPLEYRD